MLPPAARVFSNAHLYIERLKATMNFVFVVEMLTQPAHHFRLTLTLLLFLCLPLTTSAQTSKPSVTFEEVPASKSGITWIHNNAHSSDRYLPETVGAGCAFLDYDNDGWMDIYLV
ncbi:MAG: hypothetical protein DMF72_02445, partial [Acidobacteria bacterium]